MPQSHPRVIFLTGAPNCATLDWTESGLLSSTSTDLSPSVPKPSKWQSAWRSVPLQPEHLPTGFSQGVPWLGASFSDAQHPNPSGYIPGPDNSIGTDAQTSFLTSSDLSISCVLPIPKPDSHAGTTQPQNESFSSLSDDAISHFYEHSLAIHQDIASSQIVIPEETSIVHSTEDDEESKDRSIEEQEEEGETSLLATTTTTTTDESVISNDATPVPVRRIEIRGQITPIKDIPNAGYLHSITPQTMTVTVIVGIISIGIPRVVRTRRTGNEMSIVELLVGDETRAGFGINLWLPHPTSTHRQVSKTRDRIPDLATVLEDLRPQDIVLAENVALSTYQGRVYGQSLRKGFTRLHLLHRVRLTPEEQRRKRRRGGGGERGVYSSSELDRAGDEDRHAVKIRDVRDWLLRFVGAAAVGNAGRHTHSVHNGGGVGRRKEEEVLPADTP